MNGARTQDSAQPLARKVYTPWEGGQLDRKRNLISYIRDGYRIETFIIEEQ